MAITWEVTITPKCVAEHRVRIVAVRNDDVAETTDSITIPDVVIETAEQKTAALNQIWDKWQELLLRQSKIDAVIEGMESAAKVNLEARE